MSQLIKRGDYIKGNFYFIKNVLLYYSMFFAIFY